jgi:nicotinate-nucleotide adenylyltransferase
MQNRIGVYGGKFDPIHIGHLICAEMSRDAFALDKVLFVTSANPPHASGASSAEHRHRLVQAACSPNAFFEACDVELKRQGPSYMVDTIAELQARYGSACELFLLTSSEYLEPSHPWHLTRWHRGPELLQACQLLVFTRPGHELATVKEWAAALPRARVLFLDLCPSPPVSSTLIRDRVRAGKSVWYMVLTEVWQVIRELGLYGSSKPKVIEPRSDVGENDAKPVEKKKGSDHVLPPGPGEKEDQPHKRARAHQRDHSEESQHQSGRAEVGKPGQSDPAGQDGQRAPFA